MARKSETDRGVAYPRLTADQVNTVIAELLNSRQDGCTVCPVSEVDDVVGYLVAFYTKRWGLPPCVRSRAGV